MNAVLILRLVGSILIIVGSLVSSAPVDIKWLGIGIFALSFCFG